jgi:hypothetical protein
MACGNKLKKTKFRPFRTTFCSLFRDAWSIGIFRILGWLLFLAAVGYLEWLI